jgi:beta-N-acetylhexosaminidase
MPVVEASAEELERDLFPFRKLNAAPMGMSAHLLFTAWDEERPASISPRIISEIIRGEIGFDGLLMSDDLHMEALKGTPGERAAAAIAAGSDLALYCSGVLAENESVAGALGAISEAAKERLDRAMARTGQGSGDAEALAAKRDALLAYA